VDGVGIALESDFRMWRELADGRLACPMREPPRVVLTTQWIVCPHEHLRRKKVRLFLDWVRAERNAWRSSIRETT
jgi:LysR family glycine cleavage system transcriptional activator